MKTNAINSVLDYTYENERNHYECFLSEEIDLDEEVSDEKLYELGRQHNLNHIWLDAYQAYTELKELINEQL